MLMQFVCHAKRDSGAITGYTIACIRMQSEVTFEAHGRSVAILIAK
ncbi:hypothetical protein X831_gp124 [Pseudomonas phage PAK_P2]|uniref:Uncharacterized protein n=1 Tax=Pseudomonas phage PAK_P2 TaxID=1348912 RepID=V5JWV6_9CAUD|nr:hypothetical protein X831_gp124 [Pseudomonas phage PAK_P2]AGR89244.1 hypothetical protein PAK_P200123c [Pseudomonas phage PAK_P2]